MSQPTTTDRANPKPRNRRKVEVGSVTSDKMDKTRRVEVKRLVPHPKYGKYMKRRTVCYIHDEKNETRVGDLVEIMETRPLSKLKRWRLVRILRKAPSHEEADEAARLDAESRLQATSTQKQEPEADSTEATSSETE